jgi:N-ethylmaleimide reductase
MLFNLLKVGALTPPNRILLAPLTLTALLRERLNAFNLAYLDVIRADFFGLQKAKVLTVAREKYKGVLICNMGNTAEEAKAAIAAGKLDAVTFGNASKVA